MTTYVGTLKASRWERFARPSQTASARAPKGSRIELIPINRTPNGPPKRLTAATLAAVPALYGLLVLLGGVELRVLHLVLVALASVAAALAVHRTIARRDERIAELVATNATLSAELAASQDRERRRLADELHDEALQLVIAASQDATEVDESHPDESTAILRATLDEAVTRLRDLVREVHPLTAVAGGPENALAGICARNARRARFTWNVRVDDAAAGVADELLVGVARELVVNVAKHAAATHVEVALVERAGWVILEVSDDGRGMAPGVAAEARGRGHLGLASCADRVAAVGGRLTATSTEGEGTIVRAVVPAA